MVIYYTNITGLDLAHVLVCIPYAMSMNTVEYTVARHNNMPIHKWNPNTPNSASLWKGQRTEYLSPVRDN